MKRIDALLKTAKYLVAGASSIALVATAFTTSALAEAKEKSSSLDSTPFAKLLQQGTNGVQELVDTVSQDAQQLINLTDDETLSLAHENNSDDAPGVSSTIAPSAVESLDTSVTGNDEPIVIQGDTVIIQGDTTATAIRTAMQSADPNVATTVLFKNQIVITTDQGMDGPFDSFTWLKKVVSEDGAKVSFAAAGGANAPSLQYFFYDCGGLESIDCLSVWDVSNVTGDTCMGGMFSGCTSLSSLDALSTWDVSSVSNASCMFEMFSGCTDLTSLDALSAWDVSNVSGVGCMQGMFYGCTNLTSIDGIQKWNIAKAIDSSAGVYVMFNGCTSLTSLAVNPSGGFQVTSDMAFPASFTAGGNTWWPTKGASAGCSTSEMITNSADTATYGNRWIRNAPYVTDAEPSVTWTTTVKPYTGLNQRIGPDTVEVNGVELTPGVDYTVYYTKANKSVQEDANVLGGNPLQIDDGTYPVVREEGTYTAKLYLQGKYVGKDDPSYTQTVYVGDAPVTIVELTFNAAGGIFASTGTNTLTLTDLIPGEELSSVETPTLAGYTFAGWEDEAGNPVSFPLTIPDANATYTATWSSEPGPGPTPPGPTPGPEPAPTPEPTPASDGTLIPSTGDSTSMATAVLSMSADALLGVAVLGLAMNRRGATRRK